VALIKSVEHRGVDLPSGYWRAEQFHMTSKVKCRAHFFLYADLTAAGLGEEPLDAVAVDFEYDLNAAENLNTQAYNTAKLLPTFSGATDA
jgi:hypothetical protein